MSRRHRASRGFSVPRIPFFDYERAKDKACDSKQIYYNSIDAESAALMARMRTSENNIRPYKCRYCAYFHIGHQYI